MSDARLSCNYGITAEMLGGMLDFNAVEAVVDATHRYKEIFYESND